MWEKPVHFSAWLHIHISYEYVTEVFCVINFLFESIFILRKMYKRYIKA